MKVEPADLDYKSRKKGRSIGSDTTTLPLSGQDSAVQTGSAEYYGPSEEQSLNGTKPIQSEKCKDEGDKEGNNGADELDDFFASLE